MSNFLDRVCTDTCEFIDLQDNEVKFYKGSGDVVVFVYEDIATIQDIIYLADMPPPKITEVFEKAIKHGNAFFGLFSCYQLCNPIKIEDIAQVKKLIR